jgi:hypothetical protein
MRRHSRALANDTTTTGLGPRNGRSVAVSFPLGTPGFAVLGLAFDVAISGLTLTGGHPIGSQPRMRSTAPPRRTNGHRIVDALVCSTLRLTFFRAARGQLS